MSDTLRDDYADNTRANTVPGEDVAGADSSDGTMGQVAGTGSGAIAGGVIGAAVGGPIGAVIGAVAGGVLGSAAGEAAHKVGDDHDDVNTVTGRDGSTGRDVGAGAGALSGAVLGSAAGPLGTVGGAVAGGMLGAAAGDAAKHVGEGNGPVSGITNAGDTSYGSTGSGVTGMGMNPVMGTAGYDASAPYGTYQGRQITRGEYDTLPENDRLRVQLLQESLHVEKAERQAGEVEISKRVVEEHVQVPVTLEREEIVIHRRAVGAGEAGATVAGQVIGDETIVVPVREEFAQVTKDVRVSEEIEIEKRMVSEQKTISDTVRHEEVDIDSAKVQGRVHVDGENSGSL